MKQKLFYCAPRFCGSETWSWHSGNGLSLPQLGVGITWTLLHSHVWLLSWDDCKAEFSCDCQSMFMWPLYVVGFLAAWQLGSKRDSLIMCVLRELGGLGFGSHMTWLPLHSIAWRIHKFRFNERSVLTLPPEERNVKELVATFQKPQHIPCMS